MDILPKDLAPGESPYQLGVIARPISPYLKPEGTPFVRVAQAFGSLVAPEIVWEVVGVDVSVWQGLITWAVTKPLVDFVIIRAGHGSGADTQLANNRAGATQQEIPFGLYWYVTPAIDWRDISRNFATIYKEAPGQLPPVMDVEDHNNFSKTALTAYMRNLLVDFEQRVGVRPMIYTSGSFWNTYLLRCPWAKTYKLWVANYTTAGKPYMPADWDKWTLWQWSNKGDGKTFGAQSKFIDQNRYNGTRSEFDVEFNLKSHDVYIPIVIKMMALPTSTPYLYIRSAPSKTASTVGKLQPGDLFNAKNFGGANAWAQITGGQYDGNWVCLELDGHRYSDLVQQKLESSGQ